MFQLEFQIKSKLYISDMSYTMSQFGNQKEMLEKSIDEMFLKNLNGTVMRNSRFVRTKVMQENFQSEKNKLSSSVSISVSVCLCVQKFKKMDTD